MKRLLWFIMIFITGILPVQAQETFIEFSWQAGDFALRYPGDWETPLPLSQEEAGREVLRLAQISVAAPQTRPPAVPFINLILLLQPEGDNAPFALLEAELAALDILPANALPGRLIGREAQTTSGTDRAALLFGLGRVARLNSGEVLMVVGRAAAAQRESFTTTFNNVADSLVSGADTLTDAPQYGVLWHTETAASDGEHAFLDTRALILGRDNTLYLADEFAGLLTINAQNGQVLSSVPIAEQTLPTAIALDSLGQIYVADRFCQCVRVFEDETQVTAFSDFGEDAPLSLVISADDTLYATDVTEEGLFIVRVLAADAQRTLLFDEILAEQPQLTIDRSGQILALVNNQTMYGLRDSGFEALYELETPTLQANAITIDPMNRLVVATQRRGILIFDNAGTLVNRVGQIADDVPAAGELFNPQGVAVDEDGTLYWTDSDGRFGNVTAMSLAVERGRVGSMNLIPGRVVEGIFDEATNQQAWTLNAAAGDVVTLTAIADFESDDLDLALRLIDPNQREVGAVDNDEEGFLLNFFDPHLRNITLNSAGQYLVLVERVFGSGGYQLGLSVAQAFALQNAEAELTGRLSAPLPSQRWAFEGQSGQVLSVTMRAQSGTLDPLLRVFNPRGELVEENDDADDPALGRDAQLIDIPLSFNGEYTIEATLFDGEGDYSLDVLLE